MANVLVIDKKVASDEEIMSADVAFEVVNNKLNISFSPKSGEVDAYLITDDFWIMRKTIDSLIYLINLPVDFGEILTALKGAGEIRVAIGENSDPIASARFAIKSLSATTEKCRALVVNSSASYSISAAESWAIHDLFSSKMPDATLVFGQVLDEKAKNKVTTTIIAARFT